jgi:hypothetical protein
MDHFVQGVANRGCDQGTAYGANLDYTLNVYLMRMDLIPGSPIKFRAETRYGSSFNGIAGPIPSTSALCFPLSTNSIRKSPSRLRTSTTRR